MCAPSRLEDPQVIKYATPTSGVVALTTEKPEPTVRADPCDGVEAVPRRIGVGELVFCAVDSV
jgi:hypothetical protein